VSIWSSSRPRPCSAGKRCRLRDFLRRRSRARPGRPRIPRTHIAFIKRISRDHSEYGAARIALELAIKLGVEHAESTIDHYRVPAPRDPGRTERWRAFLKNNADAIRTADFFTQHNSLSNAYQCARMR
jgi:hypothetical protein